ncbi:MAG TPA: FtsX-like permease family protein [Steroidobacteraceae bacterium]|nr:FtsX-like permease family protein [Steroidobacteraceae bacterium]
MTKYAVLVWAGISARPVRTILTMLSVAVAFLLLGLVQGIGSAFGAVQVHLRADRLLTSNVSLLPLPISYLDRLDQIAGVRKVAYASLFFATYQEPRNAVIPMAVDVDRLFAIYPEWIASEQALRAMRTTRTGALVGSGLAKEYGWKVGDRIPLMSQTLRSDGTGNWAFDIVGLFETRGGNGPRGFFVNFAYFDEARLQDQGTVVQFLSSIEDPRDAAVVADSIDRFFDNSPVPTKTQSEKDSVTSTLTRIGNVDFFVRIVLMAVFFALLLLTANTMSQSVRERLPQLASLKTLGFTDRLLVGILFAESAVIFGFGSTVGLAAAHVVMSFIEIPLLVPRLSTPVLIVAAIACVLMVTCSTIVPAWRTRQLSIVEALRRT